MSLATITLDTHRIIKFLLGKGYSEDQAEGFVDAIREINLAGVATKESVDALRQETRDGDLALREEIGKLREEMKEGDNALREEIGDLRAEMKDGFHKLDVRIEKLRSEMLVRVPAIIGGLFAFIELLKRLT
jgi:hypothetical protein